MTWRLTYWNFSGDIGIVRISWITLPGHRNDTVIMTVMASYFGLYIVEMLGI